MHNLSVVMGELVHVVPVQRLTVSRIDHSLMIDG